MRITDKDGNLCPNADNLVKFSVSDLGTIAAVGNGDPATMAAFQSNRRKAFNGLCMLMVKTTKKSGLITVQATSDSLQTASVSLKVEEFYASLKRAVYSDGVILYKVLKDCVKYPAVLNPVRYMLSLALNPFSRYCAAILSL